MGSNSYINAERPLGQSIKDVETSLGVVRIRRVGFSDFMQAFGHAPDLSALLKGVDDTKVGTGPQGEALARGVRAILLAGLEEPKLCAERSEGATPSDFPWPDQLTLMTEIVKHSGFTKEAAEEVRPLSKT